MKVEKIYNYEEGEKYKNGDRREMVRRGGEKEHSVVDLEPINGIFENRCEWLTTSEAAVYLRISAKRLLNLTSNGKIRYYKLGRSNRFLLRDLTELLLAQPRGGSYGS